MRNLIVWLPTLPLLLAGCLATGSDDGEKASDGRVLIENDSALLAARVVQLRESLSVEGAPAPKAGAASVPEKAPLLTLVAELAAPQVDGLTLQATSVSLHGGFAYISYNYRGDRHAGAVEVIQLRAGANAVLRSQALFKDADIHALRYHEGRLYLAQGSGLASHASPAVLGVLDVDGGKLVGTMTQAVLGSYAATSVFVDGASILATSGNTGGLYGFTDGKLAGPRFAPLADARWVDGDAERIVVVQGTPGRLAVLDRHSLAVQKTLAFPGADIAESKSTVRILGGKALVAAGLAGVRILDLASGNEVGAIARPGVAGLDSLACVANAADGSGRLVFVSNGEGGVHVARTATTLESETGAAPVGPEALGRIAFKALQSVNHVAYDGRHLVVAAGSGGVKIVEVQAD